LPGAEVIAGRLAVVLAALALAATPSGAADRAGVFDFYVLSLSWSPSYCAAEGAGRDMQCDGSRPHAFILHGLWPQHERGWPERCEGAPSGEPSRAAVDAMLDVTPSPGLLRHQWRRHGTCSGLAAGDYLDLMRQAHDRIVIPEPLRNPAGTAMVSPADVEIAFLESNPGLSEDGVAVTCDDGRRLREVRICMTRDLAFRSCPEVDRRGCRAGSIQLPAVR
jgi:ribonuclease T2